MKRLVLAAIAACSSPAATREPVHPPVATTDDPTCPVLVKGTSVTVEDTNDGAAFVFVTTSDVAEVRRRATALAAMHDDRHQAMVHAGHMQTPAPAHAMQMGAMIGVHSTAVASELDHGAKVTFAAAGDDIAKLQSELRMHAQHLASGTCEM